MHSIEIDHQVYHPGDGLLLGNGRLSVCCCQRPGKIIFQTGHNEFWDHRLILKDNPRPAHIDELKDAILKYKLHMDGVTGKVATEQLPERLKNLCASMPSQRYASPMPKPGPSVILHYPADWHDVRFKQILEIENGLLKIEISAQDGAALLIEAVVHPQHDRLSIKWQMEKWTAENLYGGIFHGLPELPPVYLTLFKDSEKSLQEYCRSEFIEHGNNYFAYMKSPGETVKVSINDNVLMQKVPGGTTLYCTVSQFPEHKKVCTGDSLRLLPEENALSGSFAVGFSVSSIDDARIASTATDFEADRKAAAEAGKIFWKKSEVKFSDKILEDIWYGTMHAKRAHLRQDVIPPGLFLPSSLKDYSLWKGDYHLNYNYQSMFLGDLESNHQDTGDSYFAGIKSLMQLGEKISEDYYGIKGGCFIQLSGFPFECSDDYFGSLPLGRMAYMTGWVAAYFYRRWRLFMDREFLCTQGYPALKKFAVFYAGFLTPDSSGVYHAFPSNQGECEFSYEGAFDQPQVLYHAGFALMAAAEGARELNIDLEEAANWEHIARSLPGCSELYESGLPPEFFCFDGIKLRGRPDFITPGNRFHDWYYGQLPYKLSIYLKTGQWDHEWYDELLTVMKRWKLPNCLMQGMSIATHGFQGVWSESLGTAGALCSMLLTGEKGIIKVFPGIPPEKDAAFSSLRADGAFLVSAAKANGAITEISILSEHGGICRIQNPWPYAVRISPTDKNTVCSDPVLEFQTSPGEKIILRQAQDGQNSSERNPHF